MRLRSSSIHRIGGAASAPVRNARQRWSDRCGLLVALEIDGGLGLGEASPLPGYSIDTIDEAEASLRAAVAGIEKLPGTVDEIAALAAPIVSPTARFALETALLDLQARSQACPVHRLVRPGPPPVVARSGLLQEESPRALDAEALAARQRGLVHLKLKVGGGAIEDDIARVKRLRYLLGGEVSLRLDANGAWPPAVAADALAQLAPLDIAFVEEPTTALASFGRQAVRWAADESLVSQADALLAADACDIVVLKPAVLGWCGALRLGERAIARGKQLVVTHLFDGPVALASACELALALAGPSLLPCGLDPHPALAAFPAWRLPQLDRAATIQPAPGMGLGLREAVS